MAGRLAFLGFWVAESAVHDTAQINRLIRMQLLNKKPSDITMRLAGRMHIETIGIIESGLGHKLSSRMQGDRLHALLTALGLDLAEQGPAHAGLLPIGQDGKAADIGDPILHIIAYTADCLGHVDKANEHTLVMHIAQDIVNCFQKRLGRLPKTQ